MTELRGGSSQSNKRRKWEVSTKDSYKSSASTQRPKSVRYQNQENKHSSSREIDKNDMESDTLNDKLSKLLNDTSDKKDSYSSEETSTDKSEPSAPPLPLAPEKIKKKRNLVIHKISISPEPVAHQITEQLAKIDCKTVTADKFSKSIPEGMVPNLMLNKASTSTFNGNISTIYCEKLNNFIISKDGKLIDNQKEEPLMINHIQNLRANFATSLQTGFRTFTIFCQGLLAGIALMHCLIVFTMDVEILLKDNIMNHCIYSLVYFLLSISFVASFDRADLSTEDVCSVIGIKVPWTALFYLSSMVLTLIMTQADDFITNYDILPEQVKFQKDYIFHWWKILALVRALLLILGWTSIVGDPHTDNLRARIASTPY